MNINHAQVLEMIRNGNYKYFYTRIVYDDFTFQDVEVDLKDMIYLGVANTLRSDKKVAAWLDTDEGLKWLEQKFIEN